MATVFSDSIFSELSWLIAYYEPGDQLLSHSMLCSVCLIGVLRDIVLECHHSSVYVVLDFPVNVLVYMPLEFGQLLGG